jgi:hypothetical protein
MSDSVPPAESEPISVPSSGWLRAARYCALLCILLGVVGAAHENSRRGFLESSVELKSFASLIPYLAVLCILFLRGKNPLAFALGMATATGFLCGGLITALWMCVLLEFSAWLLMLFFISSMMLGLSAHWAFEKMRFEAKGRRWTTFGGGVFTGVLLLILSSWVLMFLSLGALR